jgi:hypothetical protein
MRSFSGGSHTSFEREVRSGLASNMKFKAPPLSRAQAPSSGVHWEDAAPRDHARQHSDVHQFQVANRSPTPFKSIAELMYQLNRLGGFSILCTTKQRLR